MAGCKPTSHTLMSIRGSVVIIILRPRAGQLGLGYFLEIHFKNTLKTAPPSLPCHLAPPAPRVYGDGQRFTQISSRRG